MFPLHKFRLCIGVCIGVCIGGMHRGVHRGYASDTYEVMNLSVKLSKGSFGRTPMWTMAAHCAPCADPPHVFQATPAEQPLNKIIKLT